MIFKSSLPYFPDLITLLMCKGLRHVEIEACEHFQKSSIRNRCYIRSANGIMRLSIPIIAEDRRQTNIKKVRIAYHTNWKKHHLSCIKTAYGNAPFFEHYIDDVASIFNKPHTTLWDLNMDTWKFVQSHFLKNIHVSFSQEYVHPLNNHLLDRRSFTKESDYLNVFNNVLIDYQQLPNYIPNFTPGLSNLDLLFFQGPYASPWLEDSFHMIQSRLKSQME